MPKRASDTKYGYHYNKVRGAVLERDGWTCRYCSQLATTVDHLIPIALGGTDTLDNMAACCKPCNSIRGAKLGNRMRARARRHAFFP